MGGHLRRLGNSGGPGTWVNRGALFATFFPPPSSRKIPSLLLPTRPLRIRMTGSKGKTLRRRPSGSLQARFPRQENTFLATDRLSEYAKQPRVRICCLGTTAGALLFLRPSGAKEDGGGENKKETQPREDLRAPRARVNFINASSFSSFGAEE